MIVLNNKWYLFEDKCYVCKIENKRLCVLNLVHILSKFLTNYMLYIKTSTQQCILSLFVFVRISDCSNYKVCMHIGPAFKEMNSWKTDFAEANTSGDVINS